MRKMAVYLFAVALVCSSCVLYAQKYIPVDNGSSVDFEIVNHMMGASTVNGSFKGLKGSILFNPAELDKSSFEATVDVSTISTGIGLRDHDLKKEKFFDADEFPQIKILSSKIEKGSKAGEYYLDGNLSIKGTTKPIRILFSAAPTTEGYLFTSEFKVNRLDFNVGEKGRIEDMLTVKLKVTAKKI